MKKRFAAVALSLCLTGCANTMTGIGGKSSGNPLTHKVVSSKHAPNVLVAADRTSCEVSKRRWEEAKVGQYFLCTWSIGNGAQN